MIEYSRRLKPTAQKLRRELTPCERHLWYEVCTQIEEIVKKRIKLQE